MLEAVAVALEVFLKRHTSVCDSNVGLVCRCVLVSRAVGQAARLAAVYTASSNHSVWLSVHHVVHLPRWWLRAALERMIACSQTDEAELACRGAVLAIVKHGCPEAVEETLDASRPAYVPCMFGLLCLLKAATAPHGPCPACRMTDRSCGNPHAAGVLLAQLRAACTTPTQTAYMTESLLHLATHAVDVGNAGCGARLARAALDAGVQCASYGARTRALSRLAECAPASLFAEYVAACAFVDQTLCAAVPMILKRSTDADMSGATEERLLECRSVLLRHVSRTPHRRYASRTLQLAAARGMLCVMRALLTETGPGAANITANKCSVMCHALAARRCLALNVLLDHDARLIAGAMTRPRFLSQLVWNVKTKPGWVPATARRCLHLYSSARRQSPELRAIRRDELTSICALGDSWCFEIALHELGGSCFMHDPFVMQHAITHQPEEYVIGLLMRPDAPAYDGGQSVMLQAALLARRLQVFTLLVNPPTDRPPADANHCLRSIMRLPESPFAHTVLSMVLGDRRTCLAKALEHAVAGRFEWTYQHVVAHASRQQLTLLTEQLVSLALRRMDDVVLPLLLPHARLHHPAGVFARCVSNNMYCTAAAILATDTAELGVHMLCAHVLRRALNFGSWHCVQLAVGESIKAGRYRPLATAVVRSCRYYLKHSRRGAWVKQAAQLLLYYHNVSRQHCRRVAPVHSA
jgi:hypothetical protein